MNVTDNIKVASVAKVRERKNLITQKMQMKQISLMANMLKQMLLKLMRPRGMKVQILLIQRQQR